MKTVYFLLLTLLLAFISLGCKESSNSTMAENSAVVEKSEEVLSPEEKTNRAVILAQSKAFNDRDVDALCQNLHPDFKWYMLESDEVELQVAGVEAFREGMEQYFESLPSIKAEFSEVVGVNGYYAFVEDLEWSNKEKVAQQAALAIYQLKDGQIYRVWYGASS